MDQLTIQKKLVKTLFSKKPNLDSFFVSSALVSLIALTSYIYWQPEFTWAQSWAANRGDIYLDGKFYQIFTAMFIHSDLGHLLSNMYMLFIFGYFVFGYFGYRVYPLTALILGALTNLLSILTYPIETVAYGQEVAVKIKLLGASGLVYVLAGFWLTLFFFIQRQHKPIHRLVRVSGVALVVLFPSTFEPNVSYITHAIGFGIGALYAFYYFYKNKEQIRQHEEYKLEYDEPY